MKKEDYYDEPDDQQDALKSDESTSSESVLVPKSALGSHECKPGEIIKIKVGKVFDDEVAGEVVGYTNPGEDKKEPEGEAEEDEEDVAMASQTEAGDETGNDMYS